jgi:Type III restriction enzyme, res subunit
MILDGIDFRPLNGCEVWVIRSSQEYVRFLGSIAQEQGSVFLWEQPWGYEGVRTDVLKDALRNYDRVILFSGMTAVAPGHKTHESQTWIREAKSIAEDMGMLYKLQIVFGNGHAKVVSTQVKGKDQSVASAGSVNSCSVSGTSTKQKEIAFVIKSDAVAKHFQEWVQERFMLTAVSSDADSSSGPLARWVTQEQLASAAQLFAAADKMKSVTPAVVQALQRLLLAAAADWQAGRLVVTLAHLATVAGGDTNYKSKLKRCLGAAASALDPGVELDFTVPTVESRAANVAAVINAAATAAAAAEAITVVTQQQLLAALPLVRNKGVNSAASILLEQWSTALRAAARRRCAGGCIEVSMADLGAVAGVDVNKLKCGLRAAASALSPGVKLNFTEEAPTVESEAAKAAAEINAAATAAAGAHVTVVTQQQLLAALPLVKKKGIGSAASTLLDQWSTALRAAARRRCAGGCIEVSMADLGAVAGVDVYKLRQQLTAAASALSPGVKLKLSTDAPRKKPQGRDKRGQFSSSNSSSTATAAPTAVTATTAAQSSGSPPVAYDSAVASVSACARSDGAAPACHSNATAQGSGDSSSSMKVCAPDEEAAHSDIAAPVSSQAPVRKSQRTTRPPVRERDDMFVSGTASKRKLQQSAHSVSTSAVPSKASSSTTAAGSALDLAAPDSNISSSSAHSSTAAKTRGTKRKSSVTSAADSCHSSSSTTAAQSSSSSAARVHSTTTTTAATAARSSTPASCCNCSSSMCTICNSSGSSSVSGASLSAVTPSSGCALPDAAASTCLSNTTAAQSSSSSSNTTTAQSTSSSGAQAVDDDDPVAPDSFSQRQLELFELALECCKAVLERITTGKRAEDTYALFEGHTRFFCLLAAALYTAPDNTPCWLEYSWIKQWHGEVLAPFIQHALQRSVQVLTSTGNSEHPNVPKGERLQDQSEWAGFFFHEDLFADSDNYSGMFHWTHGKGCGNVKWGACSSSNCTDVLESALMALEVGMIIIRAEFAVSVCDKMLAEYKRYDHTTMSKLNARAALSGIVGLPSSTVQRPPVDAEGLMRAKGLQLVMPGTTALVTLKHFQIQCATALVRHCVTASRSDPFYCEALALAPPGSGKTYIHYAVAFLLAAAYSSVLNIIVVTTGPSTVRSYVQAVKAVRSDHFEASVSRDWQSIIDSDAAGRSSATVDSAAADVPTSDAAAAAAAAPASAHSTDTAAAGEKRSAAGAEKPVLQFVIVTIQQLAQLSRTDRERFDKLIAAGDVFLVDEAHHYWSPTARVWREVLQQVRQYQHAAAIAATAAGEASQRKLKAMFGLTATLPRSEPSVAQQQSSQLFAGNVVHIVTRWQLQESGLTVPVLVLPERYRTGYLDAVKPAAASGAHSGLPHQMLLRREKLSRCTR